MRYECDDEAFSGDYVEFSDSFSRGQQRALWAAAGEDDALFLDLLRPKVLRLHLSCIDAEPITRPEDLTPERTDAMDLRLYGWFGTVWLTHLRGLRELGNVLGRRLPGTSVVIQETALPIQNHS